MIERANVPNLPIPKFQEEALPRASIPERVAFLSKISTNLIRKMIGKALEEMLYLGRAELQVHIHVKVDQHVSILFLSFLSYWLLIVYVYLIDPLSKTSSQNAPRTEAYSEINENDEWTAIQKFNTFLHFEEQK